MPLFSRGHYRSDQNQIRCVKHEGGCTFFVGPSRGSDYNNSPPSNKRSQVGHAAVPVRARRGLDSIHRLPSSISAGGVGVGELTKSVPPDRWTMVGRMFSRFHAPYHHLGKSSVPSTERWRCPASSRSQAPLVRPLSRTMFPST